MKFLDRASVGAVKETAEGYLVATSRVARTGVQEYLARELGDIATAAGFKPDDVVRVYRHADQVFHKDSLTSITRLPVTIDHPGEDVTADNWAKLAVGDIGDAYATEPEWIVVNPMLKDAAAVKAARSTHPELSMGYSANIVKARDGLDADFEVSDIRYNHLALVPKARAGDKARIGDGWGVSPIEIDDSQPGGMPKTKGGLQMPDLKTLVLGDSAVQVAVADAAAIEKFKADTAKQLADAKSVADAAIAAKDAELAKVQAALDDAKTKILSDADLDKRVAARAELVAAAHAIAPEVKTTGLSDADIRKATVVAKLGDAAIAGKSAAYIDARFDILADAAKTEENPVAGAFKQGVLNVGDAGKNMQDAWAKSNADMNAWRYQ